MPTVEQIIRELLNPVLALGGEILRPFGMLGLGIVVGAVLHHAVFHKQHIRLYTPLIFLGVVILFGVLSFAPLSSAGTLGLAGLGLFVGYMFLGRRAIAAVAEEEDQTVSRP